MFGCIVWVSGKGPRGYLRATFCSNSFARRQASRTRLAHPQLKPPNVWAFSSARAALAMSESTVILSFLRYHHHQFAFHRHVSTPYKTAARHSVCWYLKRSS